MTTPAEIIATAEKTALEAMATARTTPMFVTEHSDPLNDKSVPKAMWYEPEGPCGFAWVAIHPAKGPIVAELKKQRKGHKGYPSGWHVWMGQLTTTQSIEIKEAGARAYAKVLADHGVKAYADSRLD